MLSKIFEEISLSSHEGSTDVELLNQLIEHIRSEQETKRGKPLDSRVAIARLSKFLSQNPKLAENFHRFIIELISQTEQISLYVDSGITNQKTLMSAVSDRIGEYLLPPLSDHKQLADVLHGVFDSDADVKWLGAVEADQWVDLLTLMEPSEHHSTELESKYKFLRGKLTKALSIVSYRITGMSLETEVVKAHALLTEHDSPFIALNQEIQQYIQSYQDYFADTSSTENTEPDEDHIYVMVEQCLSVITDIKRKARRQGITISLTNTLLRLEQNIDRLLNLLDLVNLNKEIRYKAIGQLLFSITDHQHNQKRIRKQIDKNSELLLRQVTENASKAGEQYISTDANGYWTMYKKAAGAGFIIAFMATLKIIMSKFVFAPLGRAFINSMNYSIGFMYIHVLHWKVATKQPAMTASSLASTIEDKDNNNKVNLTGLSQMTVDILRTQFIAIIGNISIAMPTAFLICYFYAMIFSEPLMDSQKAEILLHEIDPLKSLSLFHAAIAGVCLFLSGLVAGYYDNKSVYRKVGPRVAAHKGLQRLFGETRSKNLGLYLENNLGALAGNFWFGVMLGSMGTLGYIVGLPIDIRHIAFSSANLIHGLFYIEQLPGILTIAYLFIGVLLIGMVNLLVSFSLALIVALRVRKVSFAQWGALLKHLMFHFFTRPIDFFWPQSKALDEKV